MNTDPSSIRKTRGLDYLALAIATFGVGYLPIAPGTLGSLVAVALFLMLLRVGAVAVLLAIVVVTLVGIWAGSRTEEISGRKDPGKVVVDEVAGQLIALLPLTFFTPWPIWAVMVSFLLFRFFDIIKPYPANRLQELHGGMGIMFDDLVAGVYAAIVVTTLIRIF